MDEQDDIHTAYAKLYKGTLLAIVKHLESLRKIEQI